MFFLDLKRKNKTVLSFTYTSMNFRTDSIDLNPDYLHLMITEDISALFTKKMDNTISKPKYFSNISEVAWNFYIGGYQPAQKWLKDRKERELSYEDILYYQKIIVALSETDWIIGEIDKIEI